MSTAVFSSAPRCACRGCGATHLANAKWGLCERCFDTFERFSNKGSHEHSENSVNKWLARKLVMDLRRLQRLGVVGRCEALTRGNGQWVYGFDRQCRQEATAIRDGRRVCGSHKRSDPLILAGDVTHDPYTDLLTLMAELARVDPAFRECMSAALADRAANK